jgi:hypothetical protein
MNIQLKWLDGSSFSVSKALPSVKPQTIAWAGPQRLFFSHQSKDRPLCEKDTRQHDQYAAEQYAAE